MSNLIKVKFNKNGEPSGREYTYLSDDKLEIGDVVVIRAADGEKEAQTGTVTSVDVPESEVESFKDKLKSIIGAYIERKIYPEFAFKKYEWAKSKMNREIYEELKAKYKICQKYLQSEINMDDFDLVYSRTPGHNHADYYIHKNNTALTSDELALIFDGGNLCFGYTVVSDNHYYVFED